MISKIRKRDGSTAAFNEAKITDAIRKAIVAAGAGDGGLAEGLSAQVVDLVERKFAGKVPGVEDVQDAVENVLIKAGQTEVAKAYILYREKRAGIRDAKKVLGVKDDLKLTVNAIRVLERRYLRKNEKREVVETPSELFRRVAGAIAGADLKYAKTKDEVQELADEFYTMMSGLEFLPNSPTLMNAGTPMGQLSACFVVPVEDSMESIFDALRSMALIHQSGGGTGFSFSKLRPEGDVVRSTGGVASGPVSFMKVFDAATEVIKQGGRRRGANMGILRVDHPDVLEFVHAKEDENAFRNFNISVALTEKFMDAVAKGAKYRLINPRTKKVAEELDARTVFDTIANLAWETGDPGVVYIDEINRLNPTPQAGLIESTNPCGEQPLLPYESCNLGSINLAKMVKDDDVYWEKLRELVRKAVHFLDNVIDVNKYPLPQIQKITCENRKIGLGVMGYAELLVQLKIPYDSDKAIETGRKVMKFIDDEGKKKSMELALERGSFPNYKGSIWEKKYKALRNSTVTTVAPTGTISIIAGCSSGIEPLFAVSFVRNVMSGVQLLEVNPIFEEIARKRGFYSEELMTEIAQKGSVQDVDGVPEDVKKIFVTALDIEPRWHVMMQAAFQKYTDNAVSKTINLPGNATPKDVYDAYMLAHKLKCKGITVYRYGSKKEQVLTIGSGTKKPMEERVLTTADSEFAGGCPTGTCPI